ncbi:PfkB family carbohydrate kinase [Mesorhizobium silamurunense]|uniref:PfkB family carbohydrate kinase n=1 Tax=Mesorhizobium silamurunense TaxID=499528 RepID=UPI00177F4DDD
MHCGHCFANFSDECELLGDSDPSATIERCLNAGVSEIVVKCGSDPAHLHTGRMRVKIPAEIVDIPLDTTGADDAFNGGYPPPDCLLAPKKAPSKRRTLLQRPQFKFGVPLSLRGFPNLTF